MKEHERGEMVKEHVDKYKKLFDALIALSDETRKRIEVTICAKDAEYSLGSICEGEDCTVKIEGCRTGKSVGSFQTRPAELADFSPGDILRGILDGHEFTCIGVRRGEKSEIKCIKYNKSSPHYSQFSNEVKKLDEDLSKYENDSEKYQRDLQKMGSDDPAVIKERERLEKEYKRIMDKTAELEENILRYKDEIFSNI